MFAGCLLLMIVPGGLLSYANSLFMYPICTEFGFTITAYSFTNTVAAAVNALVSAFVVQYLSKGKRGQMRILMLIFGVITCVGFMLVSKCTQLWQFLVMTGVWNLGYNMLTYVPVGMMISNWFVKKRATMTGIAFAGGNLGGAIFSVVISQMIEKQGWRFGFVACGLICLVAVLLAILLIKRSPAEYGQTALGAEEAAAAEAGSENPEGASNKVWEGVSKKTALKSAAFYMACAAAFLSGIYAAGVANHLVTYLCVENWEITVAASVMTVFTLVGVAGNSLGGALIGKLGLKKGIILGVLGLVISMLCLVFSGSVSWLAYVWAIFMGLACYMSVLVPSLIVSETFGTKDYAGIYGIVYALYLIGCAVSAPLIAIIAEGASYTTAWIVVCVVVVLLAFLEFRCLSYSKKFREENPA